ncbi:unnamed protein product [Brugia pahangi]|uniref:Chitin-binding type-2 domain-containing protein n=1 Tax=Brugia pahangi TaxID=6280 RepID=A0A0N4T194_BRUPA|nr:unnamed protein product [Brugia pahangi]
MEEFMLLLAPKVYKDDTFPSISYTFKFLRECFVRTNNDCDSGRCEWRRCVGKLGKVISGRMEIENCYVDDDCPTKQVCRGGSCQQRLPLVNDLAKLRPGCLSLLCFYSVRFVDKLDHCYTDANCPPGFKCGYYKKCYDMSDSRYVVESFTHIPCRHEAADFCAKVTGFENAQCREIEFEYEKIRSYVCQLPPPFARTEFKSCDKNNGCSRYSTCIRGTCYQPFWVTVRERKLKVVRMIMIVLFVQSVPQMVDARKENGHCIIESHFDETKRGGEEGDKIYFPACRVSLECGNSPTMKFVCRRFECTYRRSVPFECDACRFDEFCDLYENCLPVQRFSEFDCDGDNWFYWYSAFYCLSTKEMTFNDAISECTELKAELAYPPDRGDETTLSPESALLSYLAVRGGWVKEGTEEVEEVFVNWNIPDQREIKSRFFCKIKYYL